MPNAEFSPAGVIVAAFVVLLLLLLAWTIVRWRRAERSRRELAERFVTLDRERQAVLHEIEEMGRAILGMKGRLRL